jgi:3'(2'), 5'-bisphosphate nucleotidase
MIYSAELDAALDAARQAGEFIRREYERFAAIPNAPADISTHVDRESQDIIFRCLRERFPADGLCGEESLNTPVDTFMKARRVWVIDPIDGTRGFAMKNGEFSVMIGLTIDRRPVLGVVLEPATMRWTYAVAGHGCWVRIGESQPIRCHVTRQANPEACTLVQSRPKPQETPTGPVQAIRPTTVLEMYSAGVKMALVARGDADVYVNTYPNFADWDICAGHILVEEAGGQVTGLRGEPIQYGGPGFRQRVGLVASNGTVHNAVVARLHATTLK